MFSLIVGRYHAANLILKCKISAGVLKWRSKKWVFRFSAICSGKLIISPQNDPEVKNDHIKFKNFLLPLKLWRVMWVHPGQEEGAGLIAPLLFRCNSNESWIFSLEYFNIYIYRKHNKLFISYHSFEFEIHWEGNANTPESWKSFCDFA